MTPTLVLRLLCLCAGLGAYLCSSGLLRLNEVFFQPSAASPSDWNGQNPQRDNAHQTDAAYDRLVVVLIDALRADMVLGSAAMHGTTEGNEQQTKGELNAHMPFTSGLVTSGRALGYVAHASVPTVTMPRLKALVTGKAPAFIDILKNFNSAALDEDANLVSLLAASGKRIVFYGDDTWLKLFPETFKRSDGTSGFYTRDTVEVDDNVTRHLKEELDPTMQEEKSGDWDALVLHYLGLDHVGHLRGPRSPLMREKLEEMDDVVRLVVDSVRAQDAWRMEKDKAARPSLVLLCSDHGMSEVGNHGGATLEESSALLMFMRGDVLRKAVHEIVSAQRKGELLAFFVGVCSGFLFLVGMTANLRVKELSDQNIVEDGSQALAGWISLDADASARVVYASVVLLTVLTSLAGRNLRLSLMEMIIWLLVGLLQRDANFPTLSLLCLQMESVARLLRCEQAAALRQDGVIVAGLALWVSQAAFFALGNSHLWLDATTSVKASSTLSGRETQGLTGSTNATKAACLTIFTYQALRFAVYTVVVYFMRFHLFIWSVFAPKMLYEVAHLAVSLVLVALLAPATSNSERELNGPTKPRHMDYESTTTT
ncbi:hypothetical protein PF010_g1178 [Phytophthora fragariae]|uniref:Uncharacterized protein n=1 Tax=Phytophthora fragariae TaxID=53985 RepID=A0A6A3V5Q9_9STRA|nr:hypothetical protein PF010_g1178 [Phytophthora fragariae]KAE9154793.1 hypothetical protein PF006_g1199 [Phytophthora fragariae]